MDDTIYRHFGLQLSEMFYVKHMTKANYYEGFRDYVRRTIFEGMYQNLLPKRTINRKADISYIGNYSLNKVMNRYAKAGWIKDDVAQWPRLKDLCDTFYEWNLEDFQNRDKQTFNETVQDFLADHQFHEVSNLTQLFAFEKSTLFI